MCKELKNIGSLYLDQNNQFLSWMSRNVGNWTWNVIKMLVQFQHLNCNGYIYVTVISMLFSVMYGALVGYRPSVFYCNSAFIQFFLGDAALQSRRLSPFCL